MVSITISSIHVTEGKAQTFPSSLLITDVLFFLKCKKTPDCGSMRQWENRSHSEADLYRDRSGFLPSFLVFFLWFGKSSSLSLSSLWQQPPNSLPDSSLVPLFPMFISGYSFIYQTLKLCHFTALKTLMFP
jgi:hypothetical protein